MIAGILKESEGENRVALMPESVRALVDMGIEVWVETGAGDRAFAGDAKYQEANAKIVSREDVLNRSDLIISIHPPEEDALPKLRGKVLISMLNPLVNKPLVDRLLELNITALSLDNIPRTTRAQAMDVLSSMASVAGYKAVIIAAERLPKFFPMFITAAGTITPAKVLVLGAGVAGLMAIATAKRLGAVVEAFDVRKAAKEEVESLGAKFVEVEGARDEAAAGGYAVEQTEEYKRKQQAKIQEHAVKSDVIICTAQIPGKRAPLLITKATVEQMKPGSVIVDLAASSGGNCELTENDREIRHNHVTIIGNSNLPSTVPVDASKMFGKNIINLLKLLIREGQLQLDFNDDIIAGTCVTHQGKIISERVKQYYTPQNT